MHKMFVFNQNRNNQNCMTVLSPSYNPGALKQYTSLPGEIYDADSHCRHIFGAGYSFCKVSFEHTHIYIYDSNYKGLIWEI